MTLYLPLTRVFTRTFSSTTKQCLEHKFADKRLLRVAIIGAPNAGKSTLLNRLVDSEISGVSNKVHTTRSNILGVFTQDNTQLEFYDTPGLITRQHTLRHRLEDSLLFDPPKAITQCDLVAVLVDASNIREQKRLNKGVLSLLNSHQEKESILILNKVDLVKEKRKLIDIGIRLTQGHLSDRPTLSHRDVRKMSKNTIKDLNLTRYLDPRLAGEKRRPLHKYVTELDIVEDNNLTSVDADQNPADNLDLISYNHFSDIFSISALQEDGVEELRDHLISRAMPVAEWPHGPDYLTNKTSNDLVHEIIRGKVLDYTPGAVPYQVKFKYLRCAYDDMGSFHVHLEIRCPKNYMVSNVVGEHGVNIFRIIEDSRDIISKTLKCDVKLSIVVLSPQDKDRLRL